MDNNFITRQEHEEFARRQDEENKRQNHRITTLEEMVKQVNSLTISVERMAINMENMLEVLKKQGERIGALEEEPDISHEQIELSVNVKNLLESIKRQGERIGRLEMAPVESGRQVKNAIVTAVISSVVGAVIGAVLMLL